MIIIEFVTQKKNDNYQVETGGFFCLSKDGLSWE